MKGKKTICLVLAAILLLALPLPAQAVDNIDVDRAVGLTVEAQTGQEILVGAEFALYQVAATDAQCCLTPMARFAPYLSGDLNQMDQTQWQDLTQRLHKAVTQQDMAPDWTDKTNSSGRVSFLVMPGLYLVVGRPHIQNSQSYSQKPILVMLPNREQGETWDYDVEIHAKPGQTLDARKVKVVKVWDDKNDAWDKRPQHLTVYIENELGQRLEGELPQDGRWEYTWEDLEPGHTWTAGEESPGAYTLVREQVDKNGADTIVFTLVNRYRGDKPPQKPPKLPQTGQLWWPVPVLLTAGLALMLVGLLRRRRDRREN